MERRTPRGLAAISRGQSGQYENGSRPVNPSRLRRPPDAERAEVFYLRPFRLPLRIREGHGADVGMRAAYFAGLCGFDGFAGLAGFAGWAGFGLFTGAGLCGFDGLAGFAG